MSYRHPTLLVLALAALVAPTALRAQASQDLTDPEVAHVAVTANTIDIDAAKYAQTRTSNAEVKKFAGLMITDHGAVNAQAVALAGKLGVTPKDNAVSQSLLAGAAKAHEALVPLKDTAFDKAYMEREVAYHQAVLDALDQLLIPTTDNAELKKLLVAVRPAFAAHLEHARMLSASLNKGM
ncbi:MAG: DUF4142 domain-containing protein [Gemmatimonadota bacterium]